MVGYPGRAAIPGPRNKDRIRRVGRAGSDSGGTTVLCRPGCTKDCRYVKAYQTFIHNTGNKAKMGLVTLDDIFETVSGRAVDFHSRPPLHALT